MVRGATVVGLMTLVIAAAPAAAQTALPIRDNSFLIEEAYNQEWGVVQHVGTYQRTRGSSTWGATFTQEWPVPGERHQVSFTIPLNRVAAADGFTTGIGDVALNYRYQVPMRAGSPVAMSPRLSMVVPTGDEEGPGTGLGAEVNLPVSVELGRFLVTHVNVGARWGDAASLLGPSEAFVGQSLILLAHPKLNLMLEALWSTEGTPVRANGDGGYDSSLHIAPGVRGAIDFASGLQVVPGIAFPIGVGPGRGDEGVYVYLSFEHPFRRR